ncbi:hypothetical protein D6D04_07078 [Aureobasidium pullulans]|nr:hypothetical protein D6D04_07078 [Aureobasidium pullulans]
MRYAHFAMSDNRMVKKTCLHGQGAATSNSPYLGPHRIRRWVLTIRCVGILMLYSPKPGGLMLSSFEAVPCSIYLASRCMNLS